MTVDKAGQSQGKDGRCFPPNIHFMLRMRWLVCSCLLLSIFTLAKAGERQQTSVIAPLAQQSLLTDIAQVGKRLVVVGERGHVLLSDDQAQTWRQVSVPTRALLTAVYFTDDKHGWAVGHDAVILRTVDAGENWQLVYSDPEQELPLLDVWFKDSLQGIAVGAYATLLHSDDGGLNWDYAELYEDHDFHLNEILSSGDSDLFLIAEAGMLYRSKNLGLNWQPMDAPYEGSLFGMLITQAQWYLYGLRGHLFRSDDQAQTWLEINHKSQSMLTDAIQLADGGIVIGGLEGTILTSNNGRTFSSKRLSDRKGISAMQLLSDGQLLAVGEAGVRLIELQKLQVLE